MALARLEKKKGGSRTGVLIGLAGALTASLGGLIWSACLSAEPVDDAYISLRSAMHLAAGFGPVFNLGERVESASSPLWTGLLASFLKLGLEPLSALDLASRLSLAFAGAAAALLAFECAGALAGLLAPLLLALFPSWSCWTISGMEPALAAATLSFALLYTMRATTTRASLMAGFVAALAVFARPEALALLPLLALAAIASSPELRRQRAVAFLAASLLPIAALFLARHAWFGEWLPNTYVAKVEGGGWPLRLRGLHYAGLLTFIHAPLLLGALGSLAQPREAWLRKPAPLCALVLSLFVAVLAWDGGDHFSLWRLAVPALPLALASTLGAAERLLRSPFTRALCLLPLLGIPIAEARFDNLSGAFDSLPDLERFRGELLVAHQALEVGEALRELPRGRVAAIAIGALGYSSDLPILDLVGLADRTIARSPRLPNALPGHDHADVPYVLAQRPEYALFVPQLSPIEVDDARELNWLHANRNYTTSALMLLADEQFRAGWIPIEIKPKPGLLLRLWVRRDLVPAPR